jgi:hypothetical protein
VRMGEMVQDHVRWLMGLRLNLPVILSATVSMAIKRVYRKEFYINCAIMGLHPDTNLRNLFGTFLFRLQRIGRRQMEIVRVVLI